MKLEYLREFLVLAEVQSYPEAADRCYTSPSSLSRHIIALEHELGVRLFLRTPKGVELTEEGMVLLDYARTASDAMDNFEKHIRSIRAVASHQLHIGFMGSSMQYGLVDRILEFRKANPDISISLVENSTEKQLALLREDQVHFSICYEYPFLNYEGIVRVPLLYDTIAAALPAEHPLTLGNSVSLEDLRNEDFIMPVRNSPMYRFVLKLTEECGYEPRILTCTRSMHNLLFYLISSSQCTTLVEKKRFADSCPPSIRTLDLVPEVRKNICILYREHHLNPVEKRFLNYMKNAYPGMNSGAAR